jgi:hypothetical protein
MVATAAAASAIAAGEFTPGTLLAGRYRIVALLGRGGMGDVYRADDLKLGQPVALKFLPPALEHNPARLERFLAEVRTARLVSHPNVCRVHDVGEAGTRHFLSMEYIDGEDLSSLLRRIGRLPADKGLEIARQLCAGLAAAHEKGVLHRDLKPANVMLDGRGRVRLTDFGLAEAEGSGTNGEVAGTPAYMAPEQFAGQPASVRTDIYALGLVLYEIFSGKRAFEAATIAELRRLQEQSHPPELTTSVRDLDPAVERVIFRCLDKEPARRPASAIAVSAALPGGDPLAAALAAGETPSPEMVAAAGEKGGMRPGVATAWLAFALVSLIAATIAATADSGLSRLPLEHSPDVLTFKAREILVRLGHDARALDWARGFAWDFSYRDHAIVERPPADRWSELPHGHALLTFWYRSGPSVLLPQRLVGTQLIEGGSVTRHDPPMDVAGMTRVLLDVRGRLVSLDVVPGDFGAVEALPSPLPDWSALLAETGIDPSTATPVPPSRVPAVWADSRGAWTAKLADLPNSAVRIEAAALEGKPVWLRVIHPWTEPERDVPTGSAMTRAAQVMNISFFLLVSVGAMVFARRNIVLGRGDRSGATRLALAAGLLGFAGLLLETHHVMSSDEIVPLLRVVCWTLFGGAFVWVLYLALEPPVRRRWPHTMIGWSRMLTGRLADPLVGRDVLIGGALGAAITCLTILQRLVDSWSGNAAAPDLRMLEPLLGMHLAASRFSLLAFNALFTVLGIFFVVFVLRLVLRRDWLAAGAFVAFNVALNVLNSTDPIVVGVISFAVVALLMVALFRLGLLTFAVALLFVTVLTQFPLSTDLSAWYVRASVFPLAALVLILSYGFRVALAGQRLLGADIAD